MRTAKEDTNAGYDLTDDERVVHMVRVGTADEIDDEVLLSQKDAAARLGCAVNTFRSAVIKNSVTRFRIGKRAIRYQWGEIKLKILHRDE